MNKYLFLNIEKIVQVFFYIQKFAGTYNKLEMIKYLFFSDRINIREHFSFISLDTYVALKYGPAASNSLNILNKNKEFLNNFSNTELKFLNKVKKINDFTRIIYSVEDDLLSRNEKASIDRSIQLFHGKPLIELSHDYPEWKRYKQLFENMLVSMQPVYIDDFFTNPNIDSSPALKLYFNGVDPLYKDQEYLDEAKEFYLTSRANVF